jgi:hypothetical protein
MTSNVRNTGVVFRGIDTAQSVVTNGLIAIMLACLLAGGMGSGWEIPFVSSFLQKKSYVMWLPI